MRRWLYYSLFSILIVGIGGVLYFGIGRPIRVLPLLDVIPVFELVDHRGEPYRSHERTERPTLYAVAATRDRANLTATVNRMMELRNALAERGREDAIDFVIITVDPDYDDPERIQSEVEDIEFFSYSNNYFLTGSWLAVKFAVGNGLGIYFEDPRVEDGEVQFVYDSTWVLVDPTGTIRSRYSGRTVELSHLLRDLDLLQKELDAEGASQYLYRAAHLFLCYP